MMLKLIYKRTVDIFKSIPIKLWGISLLGNLLALIAALLGVLPIIAIPVAAAITAGMAAVYYNAYNGGEPKSRTLISAFSDFKTFKHVAGGMCWMYLWLLLWFIIPIAGPFLAIYKSLSYAFTPYILNEEKSVSGLDALKKSMQDTKGCKASMFAALIIPPVAFFIVSAILSLFSLIPYIGVLFRVINVIISIAYSLFSPLFFGLVQAGYYEYGKKPARNTTAYAPAAINAENTENTGASITCPVCGNENPSDKKFCIKCGSKL
jgi:hypothetical protein